MELKVKKLDPKAKLPTFAHSTDAGMDLYALSSHLIKKGQSCRIETGIAIELPKGTVGLVWDKGGLSHLHGLKTLGGVFDEGYSGDVTVCLINLGQEDYQIKAGDKVAQYIIQKVEKPNVIKLVQEISSGQRGEKRYGSTGRS